MLHYIVLLRVGVSDGMSIFKIYSIVSEVATGWFIKRSEISKTKNLRNPKLGICVEK